MATPDPNLSIPCTPSPPAPPNFCIDFHFAFFEGHFGWKRFIDLCGLMQHFLGPIKVQRSRFFAMASSFSRVVLHTTEKTKSRIKRQRSENKTLFLIEICILKCRESLEKSESVRQIFVRGSCLRSRQVFRTGLVWL